MEKEFSLKAKDIENLELKIDGKLPINRDELFALVNSYGRDGSFYTYDKDDNEVLISYCKPNGQYDLSNLDVSQIKDFNDIFRYSYFNNDISLWDVSKATSMFAMFYETNYFNCNINSWDVSNVININSMFFCAKRFNQPLDKWNTSKITDMSYMFYNSENFNQNLNSWNISKVIDMDYMFYKAKDFNQPLDKWDVSKVENMDSMFSFTENFNQSLNSWDISKVTDMDYMFEKAKSFNQPILWNLSHVEYCSNILSETEAFKKRFNNGNSLPRDTDDIKLWLEDNQNKMIAFDIEYSKGKALDNFLSNLNNKDIIIN